MQSKRFTNQHSSYNPIKRLWALVFYGTFLALITSTTAIASASSDNLNRIKVVTENYPPFNYEENNRIKGFSTAVVRAVLQELELDDLEIKVYPWARAYNMALETENVLIYSINRTEKRESLFKWVGIITPIDQYMYSLSEREDIKIENLEDAKKYTVGAVREAFIEQFFFDNNFPRIERNNSYEAVMKMLFKKRVDIWTISSLAAAYHLEKNNIPKTAIKKVYHLQELALEGMYMAFSLQTDDEVVEKFKQALERIKSKGIYQKLIDEYQ